MTREEWLRYFYSLGFDHGMVWHLMRGIYALDKVRN